MSLLILIVLAVAVTIFLGWFFLRPRRTIDSLNLKTLLIKIPRKISNDKKDFIQEINLSEQLWGSLSAIKKPITLELSVHHDGGEIFFYLAVPRDSVNFATEQIQGLFPEARVEEASDYTIFGKNSQASAAYVLPGRLAILPFKTYREAEADTFAGVVSTLSKLNEVGDGASLQIILKPAGSSLKKSIISAIEKLKKGETLSMIAQDPLLKGLSGVLFNKPKTNPDKKIIDDEAIKALNQKISKPLFLANVRLVTASETKDRADDLLLSLSGSLAQFSAPLRNEFKIIKPRQLKKIIFDYVFREFNSREAILLNAEEIASIFHLPVSTTDVPRIKWLNTKETSSPANIPAEGITLGENIFREKSTPIKMTTNDRRRHFYVVGQTGTGKSYLMLNMILQDMKTGQGVAVVDPHGELIDQVLSVVPKDRIDDVIIFDPGDISRPLGLNMLEHNLNRPEEKTFIVGEIQSIFNRLFDQETMGPMFEQYMRNALLLLMEDAKHEPATLMEVPRIFTDTDFRQRKLKRIRNPAVIDFWEKEAVKTSGEQGLANITPYVTSKFGNFIANDYMRPIIGQPKSAFNFREVMDDGKILLVNLAKGRIGDINAGLLGMIVTGRLLLAALSRSDIEQAKRRDFYLYIDEFQNFTTDSIAVILSEARKYRLNLVLAHQFIAQLTDPIREAVFGNVGSIAAFRVGVSDAEVLAKQFEGTFSEHDLISIENRSAFMKLLIDGEPSTPFSMSTSPAFKGSLELKTKLKELSRLKFGRDLADIEGEIISRLRQ